MNQRICIRCHQEVQEKEAHIQVIEWDAGRLIKENFLHKSCWEEMMDSKKMAKSAFGLLGRLTKVAKERGILPDEEEVVEVM